MGDKKGSVKRMWWALLLTVDQKYKNRKDFQPENKLDMFHDWLHPRDDGSLVKGKRQSIRYKRLPLISLAQTECYGPERLSLNSSLLSIIRTKNVRIFM